jgi:hypothetical protein
MDPAWTIEALSLEDLVLAYMGQGRNIDASLWSSSRESE